MMARICPMDQLIFGGVFERHPNLKFVVTEQGGGATERVVAIVEEELGRVSVLTEPAPLAAAVETEPDPA